ncbi:MAG: glycosyltransferase family 4 protein [Phycisphaerae bacterium]|nr:glycosyltransferase family 4 protein [Phycisphaerae bacterium]
MKILMLNYEYPPVGGGGAPITAQLCKHLVQLGHQVDVVTMRYKNLPHQETIDGVRVFRFRSFRSRADICRTPEMASYLLGAWRPALKLARQNNYDVVHAHFIIPTSPLARHIQKQTGLPYIVTCHGSDVPGYNPDRFGLQHKLLLPYWKKLLRNANIVTSPSRFLRDLIQTHCPDLDVSIIPNGYEITPFNAHRKREKHILLCSRLLPRKGFQYVIEAVKDLALDWQVHIVGDGPYIEPLKELAQDSKTPIIFHGWLDRSDPEFSELYETSSIFVFPSEMENFPAVLLEAMNAGLAIITSTAGGCPEVVGNAALLVEPKNPEAIRSQLLALIESPQKRRALSTAALEQLQQFSWGGVAKHYLDLYEQLEHEKQ